MSLKPYEGLKRDDRFFESKFFRLFSIECIDLYRKTLPHRNYEEALFGSKYHL